MPVSLTLEGVVSNGQQDSIEAKESSMSQCHHSISVQSKFLSRTLIARFRNMFASWYGEKEFDNEWGVTI